MKKLLSVLLVSIFVLGISSKSFSQNMEHRSTISANYGFSLIGTIVQTAVDESQADSYEGSYTHIPALQLNYDFAVLKFLSVGAAVSYESFNASGTFVEDGVTYKVSAGISLLNASARALFHYGNSGRFDMYSGLRLGYEIANPYSSVSDGYTNYSTPKLPSFFAPQVVLFGFRGYFTDHFGASAELAIGFPHMFTMGLNYRF